MEATLNDENFLIKAPQKVIELNKSKLDKFKLDLVRELEVVVGDLRRILGYDDGLVGVDAVDRIDWNLQFMREKKYLNERNITINECEFDKEYFDTVYKTNATDLELAELLDYLTDFEKEAPVIHYVN